MAKMTLAAARVNKKLSQIKAAAEIGVSVSTLKNWESGRNYPKQPQIEKLCILYDVRYDDLIFLP